jgi:hypothetical protein
MADYFTNFSFNFALPSQEAQAYAMEIAGQAGRIQQGDEQPDSFPEDLKSVVEDWSFETDLATVEGKPALWLHSNNGGIDAVCSFVQHLLQKFDSEGQVAFEWANDCSKPRLDAYGGGAAIITSKKIKSINTYQWLQKHAA